MEQNNHKTLAIVTPYEPTVSETFIRAHIERLPARCLLVHGWRPQIGKSPVLSRYQVAMHKVRRLLRQEPPDAEVTAAYIKAFRENEVDAVLAEYGDTAVQVLPACQTLTIPLIAHFHGYDASVRSILEANRETYPLLFEQSAAVIAVSRSMVGKLVSLGAGPEKVHYNPYGIDCENFGGSDPRSAKPIFLAVGRFVEKKAPDLTIRAFAEVAKLFPSAELRMIGNGALLIKCRRLVNELRLDGAVTFLGERDSETVREEMRRARCFVQHSVEALSGDSEGTPVGILEAGASGLPVVATRHAGIPDVVVEGETGLLVDERDIEGMAKHLISIAKDSELAARLGAAARERVVNNFSLEKSIQNLWKIIELSLVRFHQL